MRKPSWGWLYLLATLLIGGLGLVEATVQAGAWRQALEVATCVVAFVGMHLWVRANRRALDMLGARDAGFRRVIDEAALGARAGHGGRTGVPSPQRAGVNAATTQDGRRGTVVALPPADGRLRRGEDLLSPRHTSVRVGHQRGVE